MMICGWHLPESTAGRLLLTVDRRRSALCAKHHEERDWLQDPCTRQLGHDAGGRSELCVCLNMIRQAGSTPHSSQRPHAWPSSRKQQSNDGLGADVFK